MKHLHIFFIKILTPNISLQQKCPDIFKKRKKIRGQENQFHTQLHC